MKVINNISFHGESDLGQKRTNNEDAFIAQTIWDDENVLAVAIDGVGGYDGGEIAAAIAKNTIIEYLENFPNGERANLLKQAVIEANNNILKSRTESEEFKNMSCVLTAILVETKRGMIHMAHIGDTRLYQYHQGKIMKLSQFKFYISPIISLDINYNISSLNWGIMISISQIFISIK